MSDATPRLGLPDTADDPELYAQKVADAFWRLDAVTDLHLKGRFVNDPPGSASDGDVWLVGGAPGAWRDDDTDFTYKLACRRDGAWEAMAPFNGLRGFVEGENRFIVYQDGAWTDWTSLIGAAEADIASAATCDIGAAGSLFAAVTGTTTITGLGSAANTLRVLRFAGALTLTHNATSLILPGGADIVTAAGDTALFASDGGGNWRCRLYSRASGQPVAQALSVASLASSGTIKSSTGGTGTAGSFVADAGNPVYTWKTAGAGTDQNIWDIGVFGDANMVFRLVNDAQNDAAQWLTVSRSGYAAANVAFSCGSVAVGDVGCGWTGNGRLVAKTGAGQAVSGYFTGSSGSAFIARIDNTGASLIALNCNGADVGAITTDGTHVVYGGTSDARLKTVAPAQTDYRGAIKALWVGDFTWKDSGAPGFGVLAQQAFEVMPNHQGVLRPADAAAPWQASAEPFGQLALWGVKDLYATVEALARRVAVLEAAHDAG